MDFVWKLKDIKEGDYKNLTMALWRSFLNVDYDIFEPVEEAELRFTLKTQKNTASMTSIK
jgi:hypothetical protein